MAARWLGDIMVVAGRVAKIVLGAVTAMTLVIGVSACSGGATTEPNGSEPSADETATPTDSDEWIISKAGIGPFEIGMRYADALTVPGAEASELCEGVAQASVPESADVSMWVVASEHDPAGTLSEISISAPADTVDDTLSGPETEKQIGLGSTTTELTDSYPGARELDDTGVPGRTMYYVQGDDGGMIFTTTGESDVIWQISITTGETPAYEPCA